MAGLRQKALGLAVAPLLGVLYAALSLASLGLWCLKVLALLPAFAQDPDRRRRVLQEGAVAYWIAHFVCSSMLGPLALLLVMYHGGLAGWVAGAAYLVFIFALDRRPYDGSAKKRDVTLGFMTTVIELMSQYFAAELVVTEDFDPARKYIFGYHPHGILSFGFLTKCVARPRPRPLLVALSILTRAAASGAPAPGRSANATRSSTCGR